MLEVTFNDESLAQLLGIPSNKALLRQHLMLSFMDIIGPVCAQGKLDARKSKHFHHLEPIWRPKVSWGIGGALKWCSIEFFCNNNMYLHVNLPRLI